MSDLNDRVNEVMDIHFFKLMSYEIKEDFPMLRLHKSNQAYRIIGTFQTIPLGQRMEVGAALVPSRQAKSERQKALRESFYQRMNSNTLAELNAMSFDPAELEIETSSSFDLQAGDECVTAACAHLKRLSKGEFRKHFVDSLKEKYEKSLKSVGRSGTIYEGITPLNDWKLTTQIGFGGEYQFTCHFVLVHERVDRQLWFSTGSLFGFGDVLGWDDVNPDTIGQDCHRAAQLCLSIRQFLFNIVSDIN
jgi:hypothetical protein